MATCLGGNENLGWRKVMSRYRKLIGIEQALNYLFLLLIGYK